MLTSIDKIVWSIILETITCISNMDTITPTLKTFLLLMVTIPTTCKNPCHLNLPHLTWLQGFENCHNLVLSQTDICVDSQKVPISLFHIQSIDHNSLASIYRHWTTCQTVSIIFGRGDTNSTDLIYHLEASYGG